ncbi:hypothetical protein KC222_11960 [Cedecea davisae]|uniref:Uncharacterized protein n=1 Tax=Cedecea davisae TaxID=158484 RepID=A0ABS6DHZ6_9ENTR|nr:hypothetical protein [Cedecea davisae]MBU4682728.1 hypothetical protein [Cedecea davisae]MBU4686288.1 hypothetical protein [Cedecea davisae]
MKGITKKEHELVAMDALMKITALLNAAQLLTANEDESQAALELIGLAEDVAHRAMEGKA